MVDGVSVSTALTSVKTAYELAKLIKDSKTSLQDAETNLKLAELVNLLADVRLELADVQTALLDTQQELDALKRQQETQSELTWDTPYYWVGPKEDGNGPYCQTCQDKSGTLIRLQNKSKGFWKCNVCQNSFKDSSYVSPKPIILQRG